MNKDSSKTEIKYIEICPCGGGQSCIVDRRILGDWILEDDVFKKNNIPIRKNCCIPYTNEQGKSLREFMNHSSL